MDKPLVSFCLMSCRQKRYIAEGFRAALAQDYDPLEIVVSDDASQDGTWECLQELAAQYHGPHKVILNHNKTNLGTIGNWQRLCELSHGELLIKADGDDISLPNRASRIAEDWLQGGRKALVMGSSYEKIDERGAHVGEHRMPQGWDTRTFQQIAGGAGNFYIGATIACHRSLFDDFPRVRRTRASDCAVFEARGLLARILPAKERQNDSFHPFWSISEPLVRYRVGSGDTTGGAYRKFMAKGIRRCLEARRQTLLDLQDTAEQFLTPEYRRQLLEHYTNDEIHQQYATKLYEGETFAERLLGYRNIGGLGGLFSKNRMIARILLLPHPLADLLFSIFR